MNPVEWKEIKKRVTTIKRQLANGFSAFYNDEYVTGLDIEDDNIILINLLPSKDKYMMEGKQNTLSHKAPFQLASNMLKGILLVGGQR